MALFAAHSALVQGVALPATPAAPVRVVLVRAICINGQRQEVGAELDVPARWAAELVSTGKAQRLTVVPAADPPPTPATRLTPAAKRAPKE